MTNVLVTGASGFIGNQICRFLVAHGYRVKGTVRTQEQAQELIEQGIEPIVTGNLLSPWWRDELNILNLHALVNVDVVIHTAACVHNKDASEFDYHNINYRVTKDLVQECIKHSVKHFIFLSTVKVNGENTTEEPFCESSPYDIENHYSWSKVRAEVVIKKLCADTETNYTILRLPLVYGDGAKGNFRRLVNLVKKHSILPLGNIQNKRSLLSIDNLMSAIELCIESDNSYNQTFCLSDNDDVSTTDLVQMIAKAYDKEVRLIGIPVFIQKLLRYTGIGRRLFGSLEIDSSYARKQLGWDPNPIESELILMGMLEKQSEELEETSE